MNDINIRYKIWLETSDQTGILGEGKCRLLKAISETGSLKAAMERLSLTYRKTWDNLNRIEQILGFPVIQTTRGGKEKGKTVLTPQGEAIVKAFNRFHDQYDPIIMKGLRETLDEIKKQI